MVARWEHDHATFALGAMLPDFERMCGGRLTGVDDDELTAGIACHHRVDAVFHDTPTFVALMSKARTDLRALGLPRPAVLAGAHIGVELLLDGAFVADQRVLDGYLGAMREAPRCAPHLRWDREDAGRRFGQLCRRIGVAEAPRGYRDATAVADRLMMILERRTRLSPGPSAHPAFVRWARATQPSVNEAASRVRQELRAGLG